MKILYVTTISNMVNAFLIPHIKFLLEQNHEVGLAFNNQGQESNPELEKLGCKTYHVNFQRDPFNKENFIAYKKIKNIVKEEDYKLVHVHSPIAAFITRLACRNISVVKIIYTAHGFHFFKGAQKKNWLIYYALERLAARWTDGIITMNDEDFQAAGKFSLRKNGQIYKVHGVGLDLNKFKSQVQKEKIRLRKLNNYGAKDFILIHVGEHNYNKHQDLLIRAINIARNKIPNIKLLLVGDGEQSANYKELVKSLNLEGFIDFLGYRRDVPYLMAISDLAVSTSRREGLPVNVMEAMATGLPLIVTNCRGNRDLVLNGTNGLIIDTDNVEECADAIEKLYWSNELREKFSERNKELIKSYSIENVLIEMKEIYSNILIDEQSKLINLTNLNY